MGLMTEDELRHMQEDLEGQSPEIILRWAVERFWPDVFMTSGFGPNSTCVIHMLRKIEPRLQIVFIDTLYHFPETLAVRDAYAAKGLNIMSLQPELAAAELAKYREEELYASNPDRCCELHKVCVFKRALRPGHCWIAPIRRSSAKSRRNIRVVEQYENDIIKVCPLAGWSYDDVWGYIRKHDLRYNPLHDKGYISIGCQPCSRPGGKAGDERSGRWAGTGKTECGLHTFLVQPSDKEKKR